MTASMQGREQLVLPEISRRLQNAIRIGTVMEVDYSKARVRVKTGDLESNWLPWVTGSTKGKRVWTPPKVGEQVLMLSPGGDSAQAVVMPGIFADNQAPNGNNGDVDRTTYDDGTVVEYDQATKTLKATLAAGGKADITAPGGVTITGNVQINGALLVTGNAESLGDFQAMGEIRTMKAGMPINLSTHNHPTAPSGPLSSPTPGS